MPALVLPVRKLGDVGIVSDMNPYDLPPNALSAGVNIRFENGKITRGPVFRTIYDYGSSYSPSFMFSIPPVAGGYDSIITVNGDFTSINQIVGSTLTDLSPASPISIPATSAYTSCFLGNVAYLNRVSHAPYSKRPSDTRFVPLTAWTSTWRCGALRSYKDFLVALNVTKGASSYPTMVKWSDIAGFGGPPASWDETSTTNSAGENILNEMRDGIVDGLSLRDSFIIYGTSEVWIMDYIGGNFLFRFRKLYDSVGVINQNCIVQVDGSHYVFDRNDIYVHDGATKTSIIHGRNKDFVFNSLNYSLANLAFVTHDPRLNELHFCYASGDPYVGFKNPSTGCNRSAVYNYKKDTWTFYDLPNVTAGDLAAVTSSQTYTSVGTVTYDSVGGTYLSNEDDKDKHAMFVGPASTVQGVVSSRLYGLDLLTGGRLVKPIEPEANKPAFIERTGIDLDEIGADLKLYKALNAIYPQVGVTGTSALQFQFGANDIVGQEPIWAPVVPYDPTTMSKVDVREAGRYLAYRLKHSGYNDFSLSGFDVMVSLRGRRG